MNISLNINTTLTQTLTPQQIQYLKLLQMPIIQLEQEVRAEIEQNPMLEEVATEDGELSLSANESFEDEFEITPEQETIPEADYFEEEAETHPRIDDESDPFEFYRLIMDEGEEENNKGASSFSENEAYQIKYNQSFIEDLLSQFRLLPLTEEEQILGEQIIGNVESDGYLRRSLIEIVDDTNKIISEINFERKKTLSYLENNNDNPAKNYAVPENLLSLVNNNNNNNNYQVNGKIKSHIDTVDIKILKPVNLETAEKVLKLVQSLDPPGIASRTVQECLIAQCKAIHNPSEAQQLALKILTEAYDTFTMKHYHILQKRFEVSEEQLKEAIDIIKRLNPKPGAGAQRLEINTIIPDFIVEKDADGELIITLNDSRIPSLKLSTAYEKLKKEAKFKHFNKETKEWIRTKYEEAKFLIQALRQRKNTMLKVMTAIAGLQKEFFLKGPNFLKPLIYKDVADNTGFDISTVCRIVNGKYVLCEHGIYELKYFFSESLPTDDGEEVSTTIIKQAIKEIVDNENKKKPLSDEQIVIELKKRGYNVARRTVAKYREQMKIPIARLRKEL